MNVKTKTQYRGTCCVCGKDHAVDENERMAVHGYTVDFGMFNGRCYGTNEVHYGHKDAPEFLNRYILVLEKHRAELPTKIEDAKKALELLVPKSRSDKWAAERLVRDLTDQYNKQIPMLIKHYKKAILDWKLKATEVYDVEVVTQQKRLAREAVKAEREAAKAAKKAAQKIREDKAAINAAKREEELLSNNYHSLIYSGVLIKEWKASYPSYQAMLDDHHAKRKEVYDAIPEPKDDLNWYIGSIYVDVRTKPNGKGRILHRGNPYK